MELINREELLTYMGNIELKDKSDEEIKQLLLQKVTDVINYLRYKSPYDSYGSDRNKRFLTGREIGTLMDSIKKLDNGNLVDAYYEMWDFVHNDGRKDEPNLNEGESDILYLQLERILNALKRL